MAVPKQRQNSSRGKRRRGGQRKPKQTTLVVCGNCKKTIPPHQMCNFCGHYKGEEVVDVMKKVEKKK